MNEALSWLSIVWPAIALMVGVIIGKSIKTADKEVQHRGQEPDGVSEGTLERIASGDVPLW